MPALASKLLTLDEFEARYADVPLLELVRGKIVRLMPGKGSHSVTSSNAVRILGNWAKRTRRGRIWSNEAGVVTERHPDTVRGADCIYISFTRLPRGKGLDSFLSVP